MKKNNLAICGKLYDKFNAPFSDKKYDIWLCNWHDDFGKIPRYSLWFDIHKKPHPEVLKNIPHERLALRNENVFEIAKNKMGGEYLNNSMCYMLFYAYLLGYRDVKFFGCSLDNSFQEKREKQKEALNAVIMFCRGRGLTVDSNNLDLIYTYERYIL